MSDLIDRQAAIDRINKQREHLKPDIDERDAIGDAAYRVCAEFIERLPSAQPERKKGKWIQKSKPLDFCTEWWYECSECGSKPPNDRYGHHNYLTDYCPNCGSYNGGGDDEVD